MPSHLARVAVLPLLTLALGCSRPLPPVEPAFVAEWMQNQYGLIRAERLSPPVASRVTAYASVALYEGLATGDAGLPTLVGRLPGLTAEGWPQAGEGTRTDPQLVALEAERLVLDSLYAEGLPQTLAAIAAVSDSMAAARLAQGTPEDVAAASVALGRRIGEAVLAWAAGDGFDSTRAKPWAPPVGPGLWVNTAEAEEYVPQNLSGSTDFVALDNPSAALKPGMASERSLIVNRPKPADIATVKAVNPTGATEPHWGLIRPFTLTHALECPVEAPAAYSTARDSEFYREAMAVYEASRTLDDEKRLIGKYWADNPGQSGTPTGHWLSIGSQMVSQRSMTAAKAAELFMVMSLAQADAFIAGWKVKYDTNVLRPVTYIRDRIDRDWHTDIVTPSFPEYPSGHSVQSGAAAEVLTRLLGDSIAFDDSTNLAIGHPVRSFPSFLAAAEEAAISRLYGGIHYPMAITRGTAMGRCIGRLAVERLLPAATQP